jgi:D-lactate dehydrogenase
VDIRHAFGKIHVVHVPAYSPYAVAEHAIAMLLTSIRRIHKAYIRTKDFNFSLSGLTGFDLHGKTVGVIGTGRIGRVFVDICKGFGMNVIAYDKFPAKDTDINYVTLDELFEKSDIISLHCPLTEETREWINKESLAQMKSGAYLINTARGGLVNEEAVAEALKEGRLAGYGADVLTVEPQRADCPFIGVENCYLTPHVAWAPKETRERLLTVVAENLRAFLAGKPQNAV